MPSEQMTEEYLTIKELAARLKLKPKTIKNKMAAGIFQKNIHFFHPKGLGPRFKWSAVVIWLENCTEPTAKINNDLIPMPSSYRKKPTDSPNFNLRLTTRR